MPETGYSPKQVADITKGKLLISQETPDSICDLLIDSRRLLNPETTLFVALISKRNDGHRYIPELIEKGVRNFLVSDLPPNAATQTDEHETRSPDNSNPRISGVNYILVHDTLAALQELSMHHRLTFQLPVIGITGSNGKTIIKEWLFQLLSPEINIIRSPKSYNSQIGVPLSVWKINREHELGIFEAGISQPREMEKLEKIVRPDIGIITNIGHAHDENFRGLRQKTVEKLLLFRHAKNLIYCMDHDLIHEEIQNTPWLQKVSFFTWSRNKPATLHVTSVKPDGKHTGLSAIFQERETTIILPFVDDASIENAIHCWAVMLFLHYPEEVIRDRMAALVPIAMRMELKEAIQHCSLINDCYNSDINSLDVAIDFLNRQKQHSRKTVILSDLLQSGKNPDDLYRAISETLTKKGITRIIGIGPEISLQSEKFPMEKIFFPGTDEFLQKFPLSGFRNEAILLKGARVFEFEKIDHVLQQKVHETVLEVNLDAMVHNLNYYRSKLSPGTKTMAMVKAFSYGSGSFEIANLLQFNRVDYLAVAYADEGVELRKAGITLPIMVMNPEQESFELLFENGLEPEIYGFRLLEMLEKALVSNPVESGEPVRIHVKVDTGMHRLGFEPKDIDLLVEKLKRNPGIKVESVFSHLAASEDPEEDPFTHHQINCLNSIASKMKLDLGYDFYTHILNSAGISRFPETGTSMVRLGIGLYGIGFNEEEQRHLRNVSTLKSVISQIKKVKPGDTIGYNRKGIVHQETWIAIVPIGYADGLNRRLSNGVGRLFIHGHTAPFIGNISMDTCMVNITSIMNSVQVREGDEAIVFGDQHPIIQLAKDLGTIPYEILTSISRRVKRVYFHE